MIKTVGSEPHRYPRASSARILAVAFDLAVAVRLLMPDDILGVNPSYRIANAMFFGDVGLGLGLLVYGAIMATSLVTDGWPRFVQVVTWVALVTWLAFGIALTIDNAGQIGTIAYGLAVGVHGFAFWHLLMWQHQLKRDARRYAP